MLASSKLPDALSLPLSGFAKIGTPDPILTASIYCSGRLSDVIARTIKPFWRDLCDNALNISVYLWMLRYSKGGEHLKVRLHGPPALRPMIRRMLRSHVEAYLAELGPPGPDMVQHSRKAAVPIDWEDSVADSHPDRSFLWTNYKRSVVSLGYRPLLDDEDYLARLTHCLGCGTALLLDRLATSAEGVFSHGAVQATLLHALVHGLATLDFSTEKRSSYLLYHRDWLLRASLKKSAARYHPGAKKMERTLERFNGRVDSMAPARDSLREFATETWNGGPKGQLDAATVAWREVLSELTSYVTRKIDDVAYHVDPYADDPGDVTVFKVFHGLANQLGLTPLNEALVHHFLYVTTCDPGRRQEPVHLLPVSRRRGVAL